MGCLPTALRDLLASVALEEEGMTWRLVERSRYCGVGGGRVFRTRCSASAWHCRNVELERLTLVRPTIAHAGFRM